MIDAPYLISFFRSAAQRLEEERNALCILDGEIGDGDHGTSMANGFAAVSRRLTDIGATLTAAEVLREASKAFISEVGATVGPLYATGFLEGANCLEERPLTQAELGELMQCFAEGIARRGQASLGDKTMLDVWQPAAQAAQAAAHAGKSPQDIAAAAARVAQASAQGTTSMIAMRGRAARLNERSLGKLDPGAASAALLIDVFASLSQGRG